MNKEKIKDYTVYNNTSIRDTVKKMDAGGIGFIACINKDEKVVGIVTDGDFRRAILRGVDLGKSIEEITNKNFYFLRTGYRNEEAEDIFENTPSRHIPVLDNGKLVDILIGEDFFKIKKKVLKRPQLNLPVVIMAGGKGTRLDPFTQILPKALIPIGDKPIIEVIMDKYAEFGVTDFYISVNHKARMIKAFFEDFHSDYNISFINENKPLGTAGSLRSLEGKINSPFFVSNCDIIINTDYTKILESHKKNDYDITLVVSLQHHIIPYGVCEIKSGGVLKNIKEKPQYDLLVNTGMYLMNPDALLYIPKNEHCHITDLISRLKNDNKRIGVFPVSEKSWIDVGQWTKYRESLKRFESD